MTPGTGTAAALSEEGKGFLFKFVLIFFTSFSTFSTFSSTCRTSRLRFFLALATFWLIASQSRLAHLSSSLFSPSLSSSSTVQVVQSWSGEEHLTPWRQSRLEEEE